MTQKNNPQDQLEKNLKYLKLPFMRDQHQTLAKRASQKKWSHLDYFEKLADATPSSVVSVWHASR
jgi:hypothetical protein